MMEASLEVTRAVCRLILVIGVFCTQCVNSDHKELKSTSITYVPIGTGQSRHVRVKRSVLTQDKVRFLIDDHNAKRRLEPASDMEHMKWNKELARMALEWAQGCVWGHGQPPRVNPPFKHIGQNLYATTGDLSLAKGMQEWSDNEKKHYHYDTGACDKQPCGHYTQVVWARSNEVGCALHFCHNLANAFRNGNYLVCNYGPAGNIVGQKPFTLGPRCTQCRSGQFYCDNGLCRSSAECSVMSSCSCHADCRNSGCVTSDCKCTCQDGFTGPNCAERCIDKHPYCDANPGWPVEWCTHPENGHYVRDNCPLLCGICKASSGYTRACPTVEVTTTKPTTTTTTTTTSTSKPGTSTPMPDWKSKGAVLHTSTLAGYWPKLWESLQPVIYTALTDYCNTDEHSTACCLGHPLQQGDYFIFNKYNAYKAHDYPRYGSGEESTEILVYVSVKTARQQCFGGCKRERSR